ncbi:MAG: hypothetical protein ACOVSI_10600 [Gemmatimonas sp.]|jgi:hypothetical protein
MSRIQRRLVVSAVVPVVFATLGACASPTAPEVESSVAPKRNAVVCVATGPDGTPVFSGPVNGECPAGFDLHPWW